MEERIYSYDPVADENSRLLILGTMPSVESLRRGFYYAHPRNAFWPIMSRILGENRPESIEEKKAMLLRHGVALWDCAHSCLRKGSLDADMREVILSDVPALLAAHPGIRRVFLNGGEAFRLYGRMGSPLPGTRLPSTSPAYTLPFDQKLALWRDALKEEIIP